MTRRLISYLFLASAALAAGTSLSGRLSAQVPPPTATPSGSSDSPLNPHPLPPFQPPAFVSPPPFPTLPQLAPTDPPVQGLLPSASERTAYQQARTPSAVVVPAPTTPVSQTTPTQSTLPSSQADSPPIQASGGAFNVIPIGSTPATGFASEGNPLASTGTARPAAAGVSVTLQFEAAKASTPVWIQTLDGGSLQTADENGQTLTTIGGLSLPTGADGKVRFVFVPPAADGLYQVLIKLEDVTNVMPFMVGNPDAN